MDKSTKQIFYIFLACGSVYLVMSEFFEDKYITKALATIFPSLMEE